MTTKPPSSLAAGNVPNSEDEDEDLLVDASDDVTVEASEEVTTEAASAGLASVPSETPPPRATEDTVVTSVPMTRPASVPTMLGIPLSSIPLPGVTDVAPVYTPAPDLSPSIEIASEETDDEEVTHLARPINEEVTRPSITEDDEEETKVESTDPLIDVGSDDDVATALAEQASVEREKALRRSSPAFPPAAMSSDGNSGIEFADPEDEDDDAVVGAAAEDDDSSEAETANHNDSAPEMSPLAAAITRRPPPGAPFGRDGFGAGRLPAPTSSFGLSLSPAPTGQVPGPSSSPFGSSRLAPPTAATPFGARTTTGSSPVMQIPAPSGVAPVAPRSSKLMEKLFEKYSIPLTPLVAVPITTLILGVIIGLSIGRSGTPTIVAVTPVPTPAITTPLVQPVVPAPQAPTTKPAETAIAEPPPAEEPPAPKPVVKRVAAPRPQQHKDPLASDEMAPAPRSARPAPKAPPPPAAKPAIKKPTKAWVDPFAN